MMMRQIPAFFFEANELDRLLSDSGGQSRFSSAKPFPHLVFDNFLPQQILELIVDEFPGENEIEWTTGGPGRTMQRGGSVKLGQSDETVFPPFIRHIMGELLSDTFIRFIEAATGIEGLIVDPSHHGGGLHSTGRGGRLMIHTDLNRYPHSKRRIHQILNLIIYLNQDWKEEYKGELELWTQDLKPCVSILPLANRAVLFETGAHSFHGHPEPLACPAHRRRNSLAVYYYCLDRPPSENYEGMQDHVRWVPTTPEDWRRARYTAERAARVSAAMNGQTALIPAKLLPVSVGSLGEQGEAYLTMLDESALSADSRKTLRRGRLAGMFDQNTVDSNAFYVVGLISESDGTDLEDKDALLLACSREDGAIYLEHPVTGRALFYGYFDKLEQLLFEEGR
jgi:2OG-Fe(II) oxygenase superfamily